MNPYYNESAFLQDLAILVNTDSGTGTVEGIDKIANFMMKKYAGRKRKRSAPISARVLKRATIPKARKSIFF